MSIRWRAFAAWIVIVPLLASFSGAKEKEPRSLDSTPLLQDSPSKQSNQESGKSSRKPDLSRASRMKGASQAPEALQHGIGGLHAPHLPPFALSEVYYYDSSTGTKHQAKRQGSTWLLPVLDTLTERRVTFLFTSNVPKEEIADVVLKKACCSRLLVSNQSVQIQTMTFSGDRIFVVGLVPDLQSWPKTVEIRLYHSGVMAPPPDAGRAPLSVGGAGQPPDVGTAPSSVGGALPSSALDERLSATDPQRRGTAPIQRPFMDYRSVPVTIQSDKVSYFSKELYPTFSHERCTDCHSMGDSATVEQQHKAGGVYGVNGLRTHEAGCGGTSCHIRVQDWRTPPFALGVPGRGKSAKEICSIVTGHLPAAGALRHHFHDDPRVIWAVSDGWIPSGARLATAPPHDKNAWFVLVDEWIDAGFPCPE